MAAIVVDTNVLSEEMKRVPAAAVHTWFLRQSPGDVYTTAVSEAEILLGVTILPDGRRKRDLEVAARAIFALLRDRILAFDSAAAAAYAEMVAERRRIGRPIDDFDAQIAAIARSRRLALATRIHRTSKDWVCRLSILGLQRAVAGDDDKAVAPCVARRARHAPNPARFAARPKYANDPA